MVKRCNNLTVDYLTIEEAKSELNIIQWFDSLAYGETYNGPYTYYLKDGYKYI